MGHFEDEKDLARFLLCSSILEGRVADIYKDLVGRMEHITAKFLLQYIMHDTSKHSEVLRNIADSIARLEENALDCEKTWGETWENLTSDSMLELSKNKVAYEELVSHIDAMNKTESLFEEEYITVLHTTIVKLFAQQHNIDLRNCNTILEWIVEDEKRHRKILIMIKEIVTKQRSKMT